RSHITYNLTLFNMYAFANTTCKAVHMHISRFVSAVMPYFNHVAGRTRIAGSDNYSVARCPDRRSFGRSIIRAGMWHMFMRNGIETIMTKMRADSIIIFKRRLKQRFLNAVAVLIKISVKFSVFKLVGIIGITHMNKFYSFYITQSKIVV